MSPRPVSCRLHAEFKSVLRIQNLFVTIDGQHTFGGFSAKNKSQSSNKINGRLRDTRTTVYSIYYTRGAVANKFSLASYAVYTKKAIIIYYIPLYRVRHGVQKNK